MLWFMLAVLLALWIVGFIGGIGGDLIHLILLAAAIVGLMGRLSDRRTAV